VVITKRIVGVALGLLGAIIVASALAVDMLDAGKWDGLGPAQQVAIIVGVSVALVGLSLVPLGDKPA
jgi:hypothetical protein